MSSYNWDVIKADETKDFKIIFLLGLIVHLELISARLLTFFAPVASFGLAVRCWRPVEDDIVGRVVPFGGAICFYSWSYGLFFSYCIFVVRITFTLLEPVRWT